MKCAAETRYGVETDQLFCMLYEHDNARGIEIVKSSQTIMISVSESPVSKSVKSIITSMVNDNG
jgi:hypothetical protein